MRTICLGGEEQLVYITVKRRCGRCSAAVLLFGIIYKNSSGIAVFRRSQNNFRQKKKVGNSIRITYLLCVRTPVIIQLGISPLGEEVGARWVQI